MRLLAFVGRRALFAMALGLLSCGTVTNPLYCDLQVKCAAGSICDLATHRCTLSCATVGQGQPAGAACTTDNACATGVCEAGICLDNTDIRYVDNKGGTCEGMHSGCQSDPFCSVDDALAAMADRKLGVIVLAASVAPYPPIDVRGGPNELSFVGPGRDDNPTALIANVTAPDAGIAPRASALTFSASGATYTLRGLAVDGVACTAAGGTPTLNVDSVHLALAENVGLVSQGCALSVDRTLIGPGTGRPMDIEGGTFEVDNSMLVSATPTLGMPPTHYVPISLGSMASGRFAFDTVAGVDVGSSPIFDCSGGGAITIINSILVENGSGLAATAACQLKNIVTDHMNAGPGTVIGMPDFTNPQAGDFRLADSTNSRACCIDQAKVDAGPTPDHDFDGIRRPQGAGYDIGASEVKQ